MHPEPSESPEDEHLEGEKDLSEMTSPMARREMFARWWSEEADAANTGLPLASADGHERPGPRSGEMRKAPSGAPDRGKQPSGPAGIRTNRHPVEQPIVMTASKAFTIWSQPDAVPSKDGQGLISFPKSNA